MSNKKINIAIIGATGLTGLELVYLLSKHSRVEILNICATKNLGKSIYFFDKRIKKKLPKVSSVNKVDWSKIDLVYLSLPNGQSQKLISKIYNKFKKLRFIDLSADFRITNVKKYKDTYKLNHSAPKLIKSSIYSIPEIVKDNIQKYRIISNPGCYATSVQIPLIPLIKKNLIVPKNITIDSKSGYSGAGKNLKKKFSHKNLYSSTFAYSIANHRHIIEIEQEIFKYSKKKIDFTFNPYLLPTYRGILTSIYVNLKNKSSARKIREELVKFYKKDRFIKILKLNSEIGSGNILNTNMCEISVCQTRSKNKIIIFSALDNLVKGASGQAIQNMNLMFNISNKFIF